MKRIFRSLAVLTLVVVAGVGLVGCCIDCGEFHNYNHTFKNLPSFKVEYESTYLSSGVEIRDGDLLWISGTHKHSGESFLIKNNWYKVENYETGQEYLSSTGQGKKCVHTRGKASFYCQVMGDFNRYKPNIEQEGDFSYLDRPVRKYSNSYSQYEYIVDKEFNVLLARYSHDSDSEVVWHFRVTLFEVGGQDLNYYKNLPIKK